MDMDVEMAVTPSSFDRTHALFGPNTLPLAVRLVSRAAARQQ